MKEKNLIVALDVGTTKVCTTIGYQDDSGLEIIGVGSHPSYGLKKGSVVNIDKTVKSIHNSIEEAKLMAGVDEIHSATIGIAGNHIYCFNSSGVVAVKGNEIIQADVDRVLEAAKAVLIPSDREVLHVIPQEFRVDSTKGIKNPVGMCGSRLEAHVHIVTGKTPLIQNMLKCVEATGIVANDIILQPIASSRSVLSTEEKELGVVLIDIGGGTTDIAVWKDGSLVHSQIIPVGGNHFTNDLAVALKIPHAEAERVKINHGSVLAEKLNQSAHITVHGLTGTKAREVRLGDVAKVLGSRAEELFSLIKKVIIDKNLSEYITGGYIVTGGGALINNLAELGEYVLEKPTKIGYPRPFGGMTTIMQNPKFSTVLGLLLESDSERTENMGTLAKSEKPSKNMGASFEGDLFGRFSDSLKNVFREIF
jgi:cell division protein FtsA